MPAWLTRALVLAVLHATGAVILAELKLAATGDPSILTWIAFALLMGVSLLWASIDGWLRKPEPMLTWMIAAVVGGLLSGVLNVLGRGLFVDQTGVSELGVQLTSGAAFTALLIFIPAVVGVLVGSRLEPPRDAREPDAPVPKPSSRKPAARSSPEARARRARHRAAAPGKQPAKPKPTPGKPAATE